MRDRRGATFGALVCALALSGACAQAASAYSLSVSESSDRAGAVALAGSSHPQSAEIHVFMADAPDVVQVSYYLDDPTRSDSPQSVEDHAPFDFAATADDGSALGFALGALPVGIHTIVAAVEKTDGSTELAEGAFTVVPASSASPPPASRLVFEENFNGSSLNTGNWAAYDSVGHARHGLRRPSAFSVANGLLTVTGKMVNGKIVSGGMKHRQEFIYGRFVFRVKTSVDPSGTMSGVVLTWPKRQWSPEFTENDIYETGAGRNTRNPFRTFIHYGRSNSQVYYIHKSDASQWHVMEMDWRPRSLKIIRDGNVVWRTTSAKVIPDVQHHISIQLDARANHKLTRPVTMQVDYLRIYS